MAVCRVVRMTPQLSCSSESALRETDQVALLFCPGLEPTWISSKIRTALTSSHRFLNARSHSSVACMIPPSPCIGSTMTPHVFSVIKLLILSTSLYVACTKPGIKGAKGAWYFSCHVADSEPNERPWNPSEKETISIFLPDESTCLPYLRANLRAPSFASVPESFARVSHGRLPFAVLGNY